MEKVTVEVEEVRELLGDSQMLNILLKWLPSEEVESFISDLEELCCTIKSKKEVKTKEITKKSFFSRFIDFFKKSIL